ncbi:hypothetical protein BCR33DRAFT_562416 [Rhizoclosmatium globosum]|uniref:Uncharacterized protein n=1 Tax=Rhizoclosmatium globosum TaxID=329046 RepID=A0A1Y2B7S2_9FUNG|nr:hypothetical protein BCR33DRAFT_562416 [Rhizoclosmatium globosum]|eukprot:ORY30891.1 hypothetical protein BCR33DRAFT_562416 [Rhizoclosmatium globosum]
MLRCSTILRSGITRSNATKLPTLSQQPRTASLGFTLRSRHLEPRTRAIYTFSHALSPPESASTAESKLGLESKPRLIQRQTLLSLSSQTLVALSQFSQVSQVSQLGSASSATDQTLALNLASPHPGAGDVIEAAAKWTAKEVGADVVELDYLEVVKMVEELGEKKGKDTAIPQLQPSAITASTPFSPALYTPQKDIQSSSTFDDDFDDDEDFDEDEVDESPSPRGSARAIFGGLIRDSNAITHHHHHHQTFPVSVRVVVDGKDSVVMSDNSNASSSVSTDAPPSPTISAKSLSTGRAGRVRVQVDRPLSPSSSSPKVSSSTDIWNPKNFSSPDMNFYNVDLRASHIDRVMNSLLETIIKNVNSSSTSRKRVIIIYKDVTDTLEHGKESGKRVLAGLLNLVKTARETHNINIVLHALCTPSLLSKSSVATSESDSLVQFTPFDNTHFTRLFAEKVVQTSDSSQSAEPFSLLQSTHLYKTVLDQLPHLFEKVEVPPTFITPAPLPASSSNDTQQSSIEISPEYLQETANSLTSRHISLNLRQLHLHAASRNLKLNLPPLSTFTNQEEAPQDRTLLPEDLLPLTKTLLGHSIWPLDRIRRLVGIAMG